MVVLGEKNEIKKDFVHDTAVYMGNHSNIFRSSYFYKIEKISAYEISRMCRYKMEYEQWTKPWAVYIHEDSQKIRVHEYGHCIQSIVLGPLYMLLGIISIVWARHPYFERIRREKNLPYTACFVEAWASRWGEVFTGESAIWN